MACLRVWGADDPRSLRPHPSSPKYYGGGAAPKLSVEEWGGEGRRAHPRLWAVGVRERSSPFREKEEFPCTGGASSELWIVEENSHTRDV